MNRSTEALENRLARLAETAHPPAGLATEALRRGRRRRIRTAAFGVGVVSLVVLMTVTVTSLSRQSRQSVSTASLALTNQPDSRFLDWSPRGDHAGDSGFVDRAVTAWDAAAGEDHREVQVIYAGRAIILGAVAVLEGLDSAGTARLAILTGDHTPDNWIGPGNPQTALHLRDDRPAPVPTDTHEVSLFTRQIYSADTDNKPIPPNGLAFVVVLAEPDSVVEQPTSTAFASEGTSGWKPEPLEVFAIPPAATVENTTLTARGTDGRVTYQGRPDPEPRQDRSTGRTPQG
jgi:hypothetical protein